MIPIPSFMQQSNLPFGAIHDDSKDNHCCVELPFGQLLFNPLVGFQSLEHDDNDNHFMNNKSNHFLKCTGARSNSQSSSYDNGSNGSSDTEEESSTESFYDDEQFYEAPSLVSVDDQSSLCYSDDDDTETTSDTSSSSNDTRRRRVTFADEESLFDIVLIESHKDYSRQEWKATWRDFDEVDASLERNRLEYNMESRDHRFVLEEECFIYCPADGALIHPATYMYYIQHTKDMAFIQDWCLELARRQYIKQYQAWLLETQQTTAAFKSKRKNKKGSKSGRKAVKTRSVRKYQNRRPPWEAVWDAKMIDMILAA